MLRWGRPYHNGPPIQQRAGNDATSQKALHRGERAWRARISRGEIDGAAPLDVGFRIKYAHEVSSARCRRSRASCCNQNNGTWRMNSAAGGKQKFRYCACEVSSSSSSFLYSQLAAVSYDEERKLTPTFPFCRRRVDSLVQISRSLSMCALSLLRYG